MKGDTRISMRSNQNPNLISNISKVSTKIHLFLSQRHSIFPKPTGEEKGHRRI
ncbi:hypothetical protein HanIR_Chr03g0123331 [Helianthus annuus]|nr:hypothetical protein HanIR_Chr03g0123331 [Helianthus annuus]